MKIDIDFFFLKLDTILTPVRMVTYIALSIASHFAKDIIMPSATKIKYKNINNLLIKQGVFQTNYRCTVEYRNQN